MLLSLLNKKTKILHKIQLNHILNFTIIYNEKDYIDIFKYTTPADYIS